MILFAILEFRCTDCFAYALASLVFNKFLCLYTYPNLIVSHSFLMYCFPGFAILPSSPPQLQGPVIVCAVLLTLLSLTLLVVPPCPKELVMTLTFYIPYLRCCHSKMKPSTSSYRWSSCPAAMGCSPLYFMNFTSTRYRERLILYSLYPISGPCSFSKFVARCIICRRNGTGSFSLMSPAISLEVKGQSVPCGPSWACLFLGICDFVGHLYLHPSYCHERFCTRYCEFIPFPLLPFLVETFYFHLSCP